MTSPVDGASLEVGRAAKPMAEGHCIADPLLPKSRSADVSPASARLRDMMMKDKEGNGFEASPADALTAELLFSEEESLSPLCPRHNNTVTADGDNVSTSSSHDSDGGIESRDEESSESVEGHERRDSGVGSSLTRTSRLVTVVC